MSDCNGCGVYRVIEPRSRSPGGPGEGRKGQDLDLLSSDSADPVGGRFWRGIGSRMVIYHPAIFRPAVQELLVVTGRSCADENAEL